VVRVLDHRQQRRLFRDVPVVTAARLLEVAFGSPAALRREANQTNHE
jgi:hypothetical protein